MEALGRELREELDLALDPAAVEYFTRFDFDFSFAGCRAVRRTYYQVPIRAAILDRLTLGEGREMRPFGGAEILAMESVVPYDSFAVWMHLNQALIRC